MDVIESFDLPNGMTAHVVPDLDADSPRVEMSTFSHLATTNARDYLSPDGDDDTASELERAWEHYRDHDLTERFARVYLDALAYDSRSLDRGGYEVVGIVTRANLAEAGGNDAAALLASELDTYAVWAAGGVVGVIVEDKETGNEASLWGIYDDSGDWRYVREDIAPDLVAEVEAANESARHAADKRRAFRIATVADLLATFDIELPPASYQERARIILGNLETD